MHKKTVSLKANAVYVEGQFTFWKNPIPGMAGASKKWFFTDVELS